MKQVLLMIAVVALVGCGDGGKKAAAEAKATAEAKAAAEATAAAEAKAADKKPLITDPILEKAIREELEKPEGKLTEADLEKVTTLDLDGTKITDAGLKELAKLQKLERLYLNNTKVTRAGAAELQKALPKCRIYGK